MTTDPNTRYELKLAFPRLAYSQLRGIVRSHARCFRTAFPTRQVNNIYFDTLDNDTYNDHLAGAPERRKFRLRWYGDHTQFNSATLEIKEKSSLIGWKETQTLTLDVDLSTITWLALRKQLLAKTTGQMADFLTVVQPVLINHYQRDYYVAADSDLRLTLDYDITAYNQEYSARPNLTRRTPSDDVMLVEIKSAVATGKQLGDVIAAFPQRTQAYSKYLTGRRTALHV